MVSLHESRKVVEDYVLYKIKENADLGNAANFSPTPLRNNAADNNHTNFPPPQDPPNEVNIAVREVARDYEERYKKAFPDLLEGMRANHIASCNVDKVFVKITDNLFRVRRSVNVANPSHSEMPSSSGGGKLKTTSNVVSDSASVENHNEPLDTTHVKWGHVIGLLVFTGMLTLRCVEINDNERVDQIVNWVSNFLDTQLGLWLKDHGGWYGFAKWYKERGTAVNSWFDQYQVGQGMRRALKVGGAVAALALGAAMLSRK